NDTTATAPTATIATLKTLAPRGGPRYFIENGFDKGLPYDDMARTIAETNTKVILLEGDATEKIEQALENANASHQIIARTKTLDESIETGRKSAVSGDIVLLSPGAASFGMFANEFERGDKFREIVKRLIQ